MSDDIRMCIECGEEKNVKGNFRRNNKTCNECIEAAKEVDVVEEKSTRLVRHKKSGRVYVWTEELSKRDDCVEI